MSDLVRCITPEGQRVGNPDADPWVADVTVDTLRGLYRDMVLVRRFDAEAVALQRQGELGLWASLLGQEAAQVGAGRALRQQDHVFPTYREHGVAWCRGVDPLAVLGLFRGVTLGGWDPREHGFHLATIVIGAQTLHATGYAMGVQRDGLVGTGDDERDAAVMVFFGDGATSQGDVNEAFVWASVTNAPLVFFCQNNQWAISEPIERQTRVPLYQRASGFGFKGYRVDGNDVLACLAAARAALHRAHSGGGPTLIEAFTYRMGAHTTSDDPTRYRVEAELEAWRLQDPIERVRVLLLRTGSPDEIAATATFMEQVDDDAEALAQRIREGCRALPEPDPVAVFDHVYAQASPELQRQADLMATQVADLRAAQEAETAGASR
jgi:pyruvate dehydrogenase E1 component alpha subunit